MLQFHRFRSIRLDSVKTAADAESLDADCGESSKPHQKLSYARFRWNGAAVSSVSSNSMKNCGEDCGRRCFVVKDSSLSIVAEIRALPAANKLHGSSVEMIVVYMLPVPTYDLHVAQFYESVVR